MAVLCQLADPESYRAFDWDAVQDDGDRAYWLDLFEHFPNHIERHLREDNLTGDDFDNRWAAFRNAYADGMHEIRVESDRTKLQSTIALGAFRQSMLREFGWPDPYVKVKQRENELAARLYPAWVAEIDAALPRDRWLTLIQALFAGNMFDLGCPDTIEMYGQGRIDFHAVLDRISPRPWLIDDADRVIERFTSQPRWRQVLLFVDNSGTDIVLGVLPTAREMARSGVRVVLAANTRPALNDITIDELNPLLDRLAEHDHLLRQLLSDGMISTVASGNDSPLIDLSRISDECSTAAADCDLVVLEGMGRGVESNWRQRFKCDVWRVALVKDRCVAKWLAADLFSCVCRFDAAGTSRFSRLAGDSAR